MVETALVAFSTRFATIGPFQSAAMLATLTPDISRHQRRRIAIKASLTAVAADRSLRRQARLRRPWTVSSG